MPDPIKLSEQHRAKLDGIVQQMIANKESDENIRFVVEDFKNKYAEKKKESSVSTATTTSTKSASATPSGSSVGKNSSGFPKIDMNSVAPGMGVQPTENNTVKQSKGKIVDLKIEKPKTRSFASEVFHKLATGSSQLGADVAAVPELLYDAFSWPQNAIADYFDIPSLKADSEKFKKTIGVRNAVKDFYKSEVSKLREESARVDKKYAAGIYDSFKNGDVADGFRQLTNSFAESLPATSTIMLGGAYTKAPQLLAASTMMFGAGKNEQLKDENPDMSTNTRVVNALGTGLAEGAFETIGSGSIGAAARGIIEREGKKKAFSILRDGLVDFYKESLKKMPIVSSVTGEGVTGWATHVTQNAIDVATGVKPQDYNVFEGGADAFIGEAFGGAVFGGGLKGLEQVANYQDKNTIKANTKKVFELQKTLNNPEISEASQVEIHKAIDGLIKTNQQLVQKNVDHVENLHPKVKEKLLTSITTIEESKNKAKEIKLDNSIPDATKKILLEKLKEDFKTANTFKNNTLEGRTTAVDVLPLKEQEKLKKQAMEDLVTELNPDGSKDITITNEQVVQRANEILKESDKNEAKQETPVAETKQEAQPQAEEQKTEQEVLANNDELRDSPKISQNQEISPVEDVVLPSVDKPLSLQEENVSMDNNLRKEKQLEIINNSNPAPNSHNTWVRTVDDIKEAKDVFETAFNEGEMYPDFTVDDMKEALDSGEITIHSSRPIKNGSFVTPSRMNAEEYAGGKGSKIYSKTIKINDVAWIDESEGQYAPIKETKNAKTPPTNTPSEQKNNIPQNISESKYVFTDSPSLKNAQAVDINDAGISSQTDIIENIIKNEGHWDKSLLNGVTNEGNGWFEVGKTVQGESVLHAPLTNETVVIRDSENKGGRNGVYKNNFIENNPRNEGTPSVHTPTNGTAATGVEPNGTPRKNNSIPEAVDTGSGENQTKVKKVKSVKDAVYDVHFDDNGNVSKIISPKDGREIPKFREVKKTVIDPVSKQQKEITVLQKNANYSKIEADATGGITNNKAKEERKEQVKKSLTSFEPSNEYEAALHYLAIGNGISSESSKKETGLSGKEVQWATQFKKNETLPSIERASEIITESATIPLDQTKVRNALIDILSSKKSVSELHDDVIAITEDKNKTQQEEELRTFMGSLSEKDFALVEAIMAEDSYLEELTNDEKLEYYEKQFGNEENIQRSNGLDGLRQTDSKPKDSSTSVQKREGEKVKPKPSTQEKIAIAEAKIDDIANWLKEVLPSAAINPDDYKSQGLGQDQLIDIIAKAAKNLVSTGIEINDAITQVIDALKQKFDFEVDIDAVKERINTKKEKAEETSSLDMESFRDSWNKDPNPSGEINQYDSGNTILREHGELRNNQNYEVQKDMARVQIGIKAIEHAKELFGPEYVEKTLSFIEQANLSPEKKAVAYVLLENEMDTRTKANPKSVGEQKLQDLVRAKSQAFLANSARAIGAGRFRVERYRELVKKGFSEEEFTNSVLTPKQIENREKIQKLLQVTPEDVNNEYDRQENAVVDSKLEKMISEGVEKQINDIYKKLPTNRRIKADKAIAALENIQKKLRNKTYDASIGIPVAIIDSGITVIKNSIKAGVNIADAIELGINHIKSKYGNKWEKEDNFRNDMLEGFKEEGISDKDKTPKEKTPEQKAKEVVKQALIDAGFSREVTVRTKTGKETRKYLDWKKLAGEEGSVEKIRKNVEEALKGKFSKSEVESMKDSLEKEYVRLSADVIEKGLKELESRNTPRKPSELKSAARKLAELNNYGLFEANKDSYEHIINTVLGLNQLDQQAFDRMKDIASAYSVLMNSGYSEIAMKGAINELSRKQARLLANLSFFQGSKGFQIMTALAEITNLSTRFKLVNLGNLAENISSGIMARAYNNITDLFVNSTKSQNSTTSELKKQSRKNAKAKLKGIVFEAAESYGDTSSLLLSHSKVEDYFNEYTTNKVWHTLLSSYMGRPVLEGADSFNKILLTEAKMVRSATRILEQKGMSNKEALDYISKALTGNSIEDAKVKAKKLVDSVNEKAGKKILNDSETAIESLASDIVKDALVSGGQMTEKELEAVYNAAYKSAGRDIGHVSNNKFTDQISLVNSSIENKIATAIKEKDWHTAAYYTGQQIIFRNFIYTFVGGGTNWFIKGLQKSGNPLSLISLYDDVRLKAGKKLDITTPEGVKNMENVLYRDMNIRSTAGTITIGALTSLLMFTALKASGSDDDLDEWLKNNKWAKKYFDKMSPDVVVAMLAYKNKEMGRYFSKMINQKPDFFDDQKNIQKILDNYAKGYIEKDQSKTDKASGIAGVMLGSRFDIPGPLKLAQDFKQVYKGLSKNEYDETDYYTSGFWNGFLRGGIADAYGLRPKPSSPNPEGNEGVISEESFTESQAKKKALYELPESEKDKNRGKEMISSAKSDVKYLEEMKIAKSKKLPYYISQESMIPKEKVQEFDLSNGEKSIREIKKFIEDTKIKYNIKDEE